MTCIPNEFIVKTKKYVKNRFGNVKLCEQLIHIIKRLQIGSKSNQISERLAFSLGEIPEKVFVDLPEYIAAGILRNIGKVF